MMYLGNLKTTLNGLVIIVAPREPPKIKIIAEGCANNSPGEPPSIINATTITVRAKTSPEMVAISINYS
jgi:hypothetical protein